MANADLMLGVWRPVDERGSIEWLRVVWLNGRLMLEVERRNGLNPPAAELVLYEEGRDQTNARGFTTVLDEHFVERAVTGVLGPTGLLVVNVFTDFDGNRRDWFETQTYWNERTTEVLTGAAHLEAPGPPVSASFAMSPAVNPPVLTSVSPLHNALAIEWQDAPGPYDRYYFDLRQGAPGGLNAPAVVPGDRRAAWFISPTEPPPGPGPSPITPLAPGSVVHFGIRGSAGGALSLDAAGSGPNGVRLPDAPIRIGFPASNTVIDVPAIEAYGLFDADGSGRVSGVAGNGLFPVGGRFEVGANTAIVYVFVLNGVARYIAYHLRIDLRARQYSSVTIVSGTGDGSEFFAGRVGQSSVDLIDGGGGRPLIVRGSMVGGAFSADFDNRVFDFDFALALQQV